MSLRQMADRLGISRDTVTRDLEAIGQEAAENRPPADQPDAVAEAPSAEGPAEDAPVADSAPQASEDGRTVRPPVAEAPALPVAQDRPLAGLPRRVAQPLAGVDLGQWPAVRRDLAVLAQTGRSAEALAHQAITALAHHYAQALARGQLRPGQPFLVSGMTLRPVPPRPAVSED
jgi:hypothetical protein